MSNEVKGISLPFRIGGRGGVVMSGRNVSEQQHLRENIMSIVGTKEGERVMNPEFGLENLDIFFADLNESTKTMAKYKIIQKLNLLETRVTVLDVIITEMVKDSGEVGHVAEIIFSEAASGDTGSATVTF